MAGPVIKCIFLLVIIPSILLAQRNGPDNKTSILNDVQQIPQSSINSAKEKSLMKISSPQKQDDIKTFLMERRSFTKPQNKSKIESAFSLVSSVRKNIRFAGFWKRFAIINFTPNVSLQPADNVSLYATHTYSCLIPIKGIKEHFKMLCIQGVSILVVDNIEKFVFGGNKMIPSIVGFALKTVIINSVMSTINKGKKNRIYDNRSYYYAVSIRF